jgi:predicted NAD/FAD-dependent oxidoreductase
MSRIAVIGAGLAGLTVAAELQAAGHAVTLFEKSRGPGGRCATRRSAAGPYDHGAPGFEAVTAAFGAQVQDWQRAGWVACDPSANTGQMIGVPSMNALAQQLANGLLPGVSLRAQTHVAALEPGAPAGWRLRLLDGQLDAGHFDAVAVAVPAEQAAALLAPDVALAEAMGLTRSQACWTVMAAWSDPWAAPVAAWVATDHANVLARVHRDDARAGRPALDGIASRWVLHATPSWSADHLDMAPADVIATLTAALAKSLHVDLAPPVHAAAHCWRYAQVAGPRTEPCGWNESLRLGACGDAWHAAGDAAGSQPGGVERAWLSGRALARQIALSVSLA